MEHDQEAEIGKVSVVFAEEKSEDGQTKESRHLKTKAAAKKHERAVQYFKRN